MPAAYFHSGALGLAPTPAACGPWSPDMLHGRLLGGLAARALESQFGAVGWRAARLTVDLFRAAPMEPVIVTTALIREGRRIRVADATLRCGGHDVARTTAVFLAEGAAPIGRIWQPEPWAAPHPETIAPREYPELEGPAPAWQFRIVEGAFGTGERARVWTRETAPLVDDEPISPFVRAAVSADIASPLANGSDKGVSYINADYTLVMGRYPVGEWVGMETSQHLADTGIALGACTLYDLDGPFGTSTATALANPPLKLAAGP